MGTARFQEYRGRGGPRLFGSSGDNYIGHRAPATVDNQYDITWPADVPAADRLMQVSSAGVISFVNTATLESMELTAAAGLRLNTTAPKLEFETDVAEYNWRAIASDATDTFEIQRGDQDADISDDSFDALFSLDGANRRLGLNTPAPATAMHADSVTGDCKLTLESAVTSDSSVIFDENGTAKWEVGYDQGLGGFTIGLLSFADPVFFIEDTTGLVGIGTETPGALFEVQNDTAATVAGEIDQNQDEIGLLISTQATTSTKYGLDVQASAGAIAARIATTGGGANEALLVTHAGSGDCVSIEPGGTGRGLFIDQDGNAEALEIDSEATSKPLVSLLPLNANTRGDIAFSAARTVDPSSPSEGDFWYNATSNVLKYYDGTSVKTITAT